MAFPCVWSCTCLQDGLEYKQLQQQIAMQDAQIAELDRQQAEVGAQIFCSKQKPDK